MTLSHLSGPLVVYGQDPSGSVPAGRNSNLGPSPIASGVSLLDPRVGYQPGQRNSLPIPGFMATSDVVLVDQVPSAISANNIATTQVPVASTVLTLTAGTGITGSASVVNALTGVLVTGLLAIDGAPGTVTFSDDGAIALYDPTKAISRNVRITSAGNDSTATFVVAGFDIYGYPMTQTVTGANAGIAATTKAFKFIQSITPFGTLSGSAVTVGTGDVYGFPMRTDSFFYTTIVWNGAQITATTGFTAAVTTSPATSLTGDTRGTYAVQSASDATKRLLMFAYPSVANIGTAVGLFGVQQV